jgi:hypothetical protein
MFLTQFRNAEQMHELILRIGSLDYEPSPIVKPYTLDYRYNAIMNSQYLKDTRQQIASAEEIIQILKKGLPLCPDDKNHFGKLKEVLTANTV